MEAKLFPNNSYRRLDKTWHVPQVGRAQRWVMYMYEACNLTVAWLKCLQNWIWGASTKAITFLPLPAGRLAVTINQELFVLGHLNPAPKHHASSSLVVHKEKWGKNTVAWHGCSVQHLGLIFWLYIHLLYHVHWWSRTKGEELGLLCSLIQTTENQSFAWQKK